MLRSDSEHLVRKVMAGFVDQEIIPVAEEHDKKGEFPFELFRKIGDMGVFGIRYPKKIGGCGGNTTLYCIIAEELARGLLSLAGTVAMQCLMGTDGLYRFGTKEMHENYLKPALRGEKIGAFQLTEPEAGSDLGNVRTTAEKQGDGFVINGMKTWSTSGPIADFHTVLCQTAPEKGLKGLMFFFVPSDTPGFSHSKRFETLGTRTTLLSEIYFNNCRVPSEYRLGEPGKGLKVLLSILSEIRVMTAALALGLLRASMEASLRYARERVQFGKPIGKNQLIQSKIANMAVNLEAGRLMIQNTCRMIDNNIPCMHQATMTKYFVTEAACKATDEATRIFGGYGYSMEYPVQRYYRDSRFLLYGGGVHEVLQTNIAKHYGL
ncbi:MAG: acyl-CoA dehydrogenase family protein [Thermodesulfobacteriota bacterium]